MYKLRGWGFESCPDDVAQIGTEMMNDVHENLFAQLDASNMRPFLERVLRWTKTDGIVTIYSDQKVVPIDVRMHREKRDDGLTLIADLTLSIPARVFK